ncbi:AGAP006407-PA-like protein [Anopheles sinensis]|uniref:AGAP006407-PA-like protein n=1 Tax=Anopheles sinensis TaxID=74873 RepID=A0A084WLV9_ANOSI|nr:AGAP006407-PA-like protein [Anopheles sinensis]
MVLLLRLSLFLLISLPTAAGQFGKPFLRNLIEAGFAKSDLNVVYFTTSNAESVSFLAGDYPRVFLPRFGTGRWDGRKVRIEAQSMVVIDGRHEPVAQNKCLTYLLKELARILNPGSNKFVLLVDRTFTDGFQANGVRILYEAVRDSGIGYMALLSFTPSTEKPVSVTRISFGELVTYAPSELDNPWSIFRFDIRSLDGERVAGLLYNFFPFSYITRNRRWMGTDFYMWNVIAGQLRLRLQLIYAKPNNPQFIGGSHSPAMRNGTVHFIATRDMLIPDGQPKLHLFARDHLSLVIPRPFKRTLIDALLQPFTQELWILIGVFIGVRAVVGHLAVGKMCCTLEPWSEWLNLAADVVTFILIEAYLAKVTSLLLTLRYTEGPQNLEQFLAARLPILEPLDSKYVLFQAGPELSARLKDRFVRLDMSEMRKSTDECYVELRSRVLQLTHGTEPFDPVTGRRNYYILDEPLAIIHYQYTFAKETALKHIFERCIGQYEENGLRVRMEKHFEHWAQVQQLRKQFGINSTVLSFGDLHSLWLCVALGWCISGAVFLVECTAHRVGKRLVSRIKRKK